MSASTVLTILADAPDGMSVKQIADEQQRSTSATRQTLKRLVRDGKVAVTNHVWQAVRVDRPDVVGFDTDWRDGIVEPAEPTAPKQIYVPAWNVEALQSAFKKLAKRAAKLGLEAPTLSLGEAIVVKPTKQGTFGPLPGRVFYPVTVTGVALKLAGWEFVARIDHSIPGNLLAAVPTAELAEGELARFRGADDFCDHCKTARRRKDTFVVRATGEGEEKTGTLMQVGRNCLVDFLGHKDPKGLARMAQYLAEVLAGCGDPDEPGFGGGSGTPTAFGLVDYLAACQAFIKQDGWLSRTKARESMSQATADMAFSHLQCLAIGAKQSHPLERDSKEDWAAYRSVAEHTLVVGLSVLEEKNGSGQLGDYEHNLLACLRAGAVIGKTAGFVGSLIGYVSRHESRELKANQPGAWKAIAEGSNFVGNDPATLDKAERLRGLTVKVLRTKWIENDWGGMCIVSMLTDGGDLLVWFCSSTSKASDWIDEGIGKRFVVDVTVKNHNTNTRTAIAFKETKVNRVTMKECLGHEEAAA